MADMHVGPSHNSAAWNAALFDEDDVILAELVEKEPPGVSLFQLAAYMNGLYRRTQLPIGEVTHFRMEEASPRIQRVLPTVRAVRQRLGWEQREFDLALMRMIRRSSALSMVLGAGVTQAAGGPSWSALVRHLLELALEKGHEVRKPVLAAGNVPESPGSARRYEFSIVRVEHFEPRDEAEARSILALINEQGTETDAEKLKRGAQLCSSLYGQHLFAHITQLIYSRTPEPGPTHRAIAELAHGQEVPARWREVPEGGTEIFPGWDSIIGYNFDALMSEALDEQGIPHTAWVTRAGEIVGDPDQLGLESVWEQPILHLHGYTPRRPHLITNVDFVFSTAHYREIYGDEWSGIIDVALTNYLANPVHVALYVGCSFSDEAMNDLLREAARRYPGRLHYALLKWPGRQREHDPSSTEIEEYSEPYLDIGVQPVWVYDYDEIPDVIRSLR
jgi:hypothetical protein